MPIIDRRNSLTPANMRNADVARRLIESVAPMQQSRMQSAIRANGIDGILYSRLSQGRPCVCHRQNVEAAKLSPDGKASTGAIDRIITGNSNFGISSYSPMAEPDLGSPKPTSPGHKHNEWLGVANNVPSILDEEFDDLEEGPILGDNGQFSPDLADMFDNFDLSQLGLSDVSCPICFGTNVVGGYSAFRAWRHVVLSIDMETVSSYQELPAFALTPGTHKFKVTLPRGAVGLDVCRTMNGKDQTPSQFFLDGVDITRSRFQDYCDGKPHEFKIVTKHPLTHIEMQAPLSLEPMFFELPKLTKSADISFLDQTEPFNIVVSPDVPRLESMDLIAESQSGRILIVQQANPWNTRNKNMLGFECQVRVAQPQELWNLMPRRRHVTGQKRVLNARPTKAKPISGLVKGFSF